MNLDFESLPRLGLFLLQANLVWCAGFLIAHLLLRGVKASIRYRTRLTLLFVLPLSILVALGLNHPKAQSFTEPVTVNLYNDTVLTDALEQTNSDPSHSSKRLIRHAIWSGSITIVLGVILLSLGYARGLRRLFKVAGKTHPEIQQQLDRVVSEVDYPRPIRLILSRLNVSPFSYGLRRPNIVIPGQLLNTLNEEELELVLRHEVQHIHRHDFATNLFQKLIKTLFFYNPCVHWLDHQIDLDREFLCDQAVLETGTCTKRQYAELLIRVAEFVSRHPMLSPQVPFHSKQSHLRKRLKHMKTYTLTSHTPWRIGFSVTTISALFVAVSLTGYGADSDGQKQRKTSKESLTLEIGPDQLTVRRNGHERAFDKESREYQELIRHYQRLVDRVDPKTNQKQYNPENPYQAETTAKAEKRIAQERQARSAARAADLEAQANADQAIRQEEERRAYHRRLQSAEKTLAEARKAEDRFRYGYVSTARELQAQAEDTPQDPGAPSYNRYSPEGQAQSEQNARRYAYTKSKARNSNAYQSEDSAAPSYRPERSADQRHALNALQKEIAESQRQWERQRRELQRSIQRQQDALKRQQEALQQQLKQAALKQEEITLREQRRLEAEYSALTKNYERRAREQDKLAKEQEARAKKHKALILRLRQELAEYGAIDKNRSNLEIDLNQDRLKVNGKRQPEDIYKSTKRAYEEMTDEKLRGTFRYKSSQ